MIYWHRLLPAFIACLLFQPGHAREEILSFDSAIEVMADSTMQVTETIRVRAEGKQIRRGIYRDFPTDYRDRLNNQISVGFEVLEVKRDDSPEAFFTEKYANGVRLYIGRKDRLLPPGEYDYQISYRTNRQLGYFDDYDELYWNVTGNGWGFVIQNASASISLPPGIAQSSMAIEGYTGSFGATGQNYTARVTGDGRAVIRSTRPLQPNEGLTVAVRWPKNIVAEPSAGQQLAWLLRDNLGLIIALVGLASVAGYLYLAWARYGRDPKAGPIFPHYTAPPNLSPGACRYILEMSHDNQAFSAAVLSLAVKGYLTIHEGNTAALQAISDDNAFDKALEKMSPMQKKLLGPLLEMAEDAMESALDDAFVLEQTSPLRDLPKLGPGEKALLAKLFVAGRFLMLSQANHATVRAAMSAHEQALQKYYKRKNFTTNGGLILPAVGISAVTVLLVITLAEITPLVIATLSLVVPLILWFLSLLRAPTPAGRKVMNQIEGLRMYLQVAEGDDLKRIEGIAGPSPVRTQALFEEFLPYALALEVEQPWAEQFESLFQRLAAEQGSSYKPGWYVGEKSPGANFSGFTSAVTGALNDAISSSSQAPGSSSGSGGGGSSGGGGGGGGGGGW